MKTPLPILIGLVLTSGFDTLASESATSSGKSSSLGEQRVNAPPDR